MAHVKPRLSGKRVALLAANGLHEHEFWTPYYRLKEEAATLIVAGPEKGKTYRGEGIHGLDGLLLAPTDAAISELHAGELDALVIPGGIYGPLELRDYAATLDLVRKLDAKKKIIAAICHGPWVLVSAGVLRGRRATSPTDMADDIKNCGAEWIRQDVVRDGHIITGEYFGRLPEFLRAVIDAIEG